MSKILNKMQICGNFWVTQYLVKGIFNFWKLWKVKHRYSYVDKEESNCLDKRRYLMIKNRQMKTLIKCICFKVFRKEFYIRFDSFGSIYLVLIGRCWVRTQTHRFIKELRPISKSLKSKIEHIFEWFFL